MFILKKGHQPGVYVPLRALFLVNFLNPQVVFSMSSTSTYRSRFPDKESNHREPFIVLQLI